jgi:hypothetical protein
MNQQLAKKLHGQAYSRYANSKPIDPAVFMQLVVDECIKVIEDTKGPSKIAAVQNIKRHFGYPEPVKQEHDETVQV